MLHCKEENLGRRGLIFTRAPAPPAPVAARESSRCSEIPGFGLKNTGILG